MSNSGLINGALLSPNHSNGRTHKIDRITPHYMAGLLSGEACCRIFQPTSRQASSNYCIGPDGDIWLCVEEHNRAWTSGSSYNDNRAITIECANYINGELPKPTWDSLVKLCADICVRNGIAKLVFTGDDNGNLTMHKWYQDTDCPGPWLSKQFDRLAIEVNNLIAKTPSNDNNAKNTSNTNFSVNGCYRVNVDTLNVRTAPNINCGKVVASYRYGQTVNLDNWCEVVDGMLWGRYTGNSGYQRYICLGRATGRQESDDYLIKVG